MSVLSYHGLKYDKGIFLNVEDLLVVEEALSISINGNPFIVTMHTPGNEEELVRGLLFSEGIYNDINASIVFEVRARNSYGFATSINLTIDEKYIVKPYRNTRNISSVSSCGICGITELKTHDAETKGIVNDREIDPRLLSEMFHEMNSRQKTFRQSGGSHAAAAFKINGEFICVKEDIGRHNAVDKVIGHLIMENQLSSASCITVSGRVSYEIIKKCFAAKIPFLAAISAPSSLAVDMAKLLNITLMTFCRDKKFTAYSNTDNIIWKKKVNNRTIEYLNNE